MKDLEGLFEDFYNIDTQEQVEVHMYYFGGKPIRKTEVDPRVRKFKNGEAASKDEAMGEMIKGGGDMVMN